MNNVIATLKLQRFASTGVILTLFIGGLDGTLLWLRGPQADDMLGLLGRMLSSAAAQFTSPPSAIRAGSDRLVLIYWLFLSSYLLLMAVFAWLFWLACKRSKAGDAHRFSSTGGALILLSQLVIGLAVDSAFLYLLAAELAFILSLKKALPWLGWQMLTYAGVAIWTAAPLINSNENMKIRLLYLAGELIMQGLVFTATTMSLRERRRRLELARTNAELLATQALLTDTVKATERMRIARDLHDIVGHQLTALNLHLNLALRQSEEARSDSLRISSELAGGLLSEVRAVVDTERRNQVINLRHALETLSTGVPEPRIRLTFPTRFSVYSAACAHALFCCIQEAISNAIRHSHATELCINLSNHSDTDNELQLVLAYISDDGIGNQGMKQGNGLLGMRERLEELGGTLHAENKSAGGFVLHVSVPDKRSTT